MGDRHAEDGSTQAPRRRREGRKGQHNMLNRRAVPRRDRPFSQLWNLVFRAVGASHLDVSHGILVCDPWLKIYQVCSLDYRPDLRSALIWKEFVIREEMRRKLRCLQGSCSQAQASLKRLTWG